MMSIPRYLIHASNDSEVGLEGISVLLTERLSRQPHVCTPERQNHKSKTKDGANKDVPVGYLVKLNDSCSPP